MPGNNSAGIGFDVHKFTDVPRPLMLGCVEIPGHAGLYGHSDADVVAHAICDALLGAAGLGDMGQHFPDNDERWSGVSGYEFLTATNALVASQGWMVENVDCTVIAESPHISPHREWMQQRISGALEGAPVNVKGSRAEGLGAIGRVEGVACFATALLTRS